MAGRHSASHSAADEGVSSGFTSLNTIHQESHRSGRRGSSDNGTRPQKKKGGNLVSILLIVVGVVLLLVAGGMWLRAQLRYHQQDKVNKELAAYVTIHDTGAEESGPKPPEVDWAGLKAINDEVVAWIQIPGTVINYPVYQADNNDRYLRNTATGEWSWGGQLFCDYECTRPGMVDANTLVYGHHLLDGSMFKPIADMDNQEDFDAVDTVWYVTEQTAYECEPLFLYYTQEDDQAARTFTFANEEEFHAYMVDRLGRAVVQRKDVAQVLGNVHHTLSLITCNYYDGYGRTVLVCAPKNEVLGLVPAPVQETLAEQAPAEAAPAEEAPAQEDSSGDESYEDDSSEEEYYEDYDEENEG